MVDKASTTPKRESFEQYEEKLIFEDTNHFLYHKYNHDCKTTITTFAQALEFSPTYTQNDLCLHQNADGPINAEIIRSVAMLCGSNVVSVCFCSLALTDKMVEGVLPHLPKLRSLQINGANIGSVAARSIAMFCHSSLRSLRVGGCNLITSESCGWLAGIIGHNSPRLRKLKALDISSTNIDDRGFAFLCKGLGQLEYLDVGNCAQLSLTGKGIQASLCGGSFRSMQVLNLRGCKGIGDEGVIAIAKVMPKLWHLNLSCCGNITNASASAIGQGCTKLRTLSLEGAGLTDVGLGYIANDTKLNLLNITGCSISRKSLMAVVLTLEYVQESSSFFGFILRGSHARVAALNDEEMEDMRIQQNQAAHLIQDGWKLKRHTIHQMQSNYEFHENEAAVKIQSFALNCKSRRRFFEIGYRRRAAESSVSIQKMIRCWLAQRRLKRLISNYRIMTHYATIIQTRYRGKFVRSHDKLVMPAILALRAAKLSKKRTCAVIVIQCFWRIEMAISRLGFLRREFITRRNSSILIQSNWRIGLANRRSNRFKMFVELFCYYCNKMAIRIQCSLRQYFARRQLDEVLQLAAEKYLMEHLSARQIQKSYRGLVVRRRAQRKRLAWNKAAVEIQRIFRGRSVPSWQEIKWGAISDHVRQQSNSEHAHSLTVRHGYTMHKPGPTKANTGGIEETLPLNGAPEDDELLKYVFGHTFVNFRCLVYWPDIALFKVSSIGEYDERMRLWQINYDGDDSEWLDLVKDHDRVIIMEHDASGDWMPFEHAQSLPMKNYLEKRNMSCTPQEKNSWLPQLRSEKIASEIWYSTYVARGLLDGCYQAQSYEALHKLKEAHLVKSMTFSIAKAKQVSSGEQCFDDMELLKFQGLLREVEAYIRQNL